MELVRTAVASEVFGHRGVRASGGQTARVDPRCFGRSIRRELFVPPMPNRVGEDLKLFATTFLAAFIFVSLLIA